MSLLNGSQPIILGRPPSYFMKWPKDLKLPSSPKDGVWLASMYEFFMDGRVPVTVAALYFALSHQANHYRRNNRKPCGFTQTAAFKAFVIAHNLFLCVYSAWTFLGMTSAIGRTVYDITMSDKSPLERYFSGAGDSTARWFGVWRALCDLNDGIWSNGLSYYGYFFYLSKYYEIVDTVIILLKGRPSSLLQTYHHSGAMFCMWAGMRYSSPPIWIFLVFNSFIHTLMYFYYFMSTIKVPVPKALKQSLTTLQITQFVLGGSLATLHLFIYYFDPKSGSHCACLKDAGQTFALTVNVFYLAPLTYLFVEFAIKTYARKSKDNAIAAAARKSQKEATKAN